MGLSPPVPDPAMMVCLVHYRTTKKSKDRQLHELPLLALSSRATPRPCRFGGGREGKRGEAVGREEGTLGVEGSGREEEGGGTRGPRVKKGSRGKKR